MVVWPVVVSAVVVSLDWVVEVAVLSLWSALHAAIALDEIKIATIEKINALSIVKSFAIPIHVENEVRLNSTQKQIGGDSCQ